MAKDGTLIIIPKAEGRKEAEESGDPIFLWQRCTRLDVTSQLWPKEASKQHLTLTAHSPMQHPIHSFTS